MRPPQGPEKPGHSSCGAQDGAAKPPPGVGDHRVGPVFAKPRAMRRKWIISAAAAGLLVPLTAAAPALDHETFPRTAGAATTAQTKAQVLAERLAEEHGIKVKVDARLRRTLDSVEDGPIGADFEAAVERLRSLDEDVARQLTQSDLAPLSLAVAIVESGLKNERARPGEKQPLGYFQLMPKTARNYGLKVTPRKDERLDPAAAQQAAETLLRDLHERFGGWEAALAAYNEGEGRVASRGGPIATPYVRRVLAMALLLLDAGVV